MLVLAFISQSLVVAAMPCQWMTTTPVAHDMSNMDHSMMDMGHDMSQMNHSDMSSDLTQPHECCKTMSHCGSSSCSLPALGYNVAFTTVTDSSLLVDNYPQALPSSPVSSLYRPPIFR